MYSLTFWQHYLLSACSSMYPDALKPWIESISPCNFKIRLFWFGLLLARSIINLSSCRPTTFLCRMWFLYSWFLTLEGGYSLNSKRVWNLLSYASLTRHYAHTTMCSEVYHSSRDYWIIIKNVICVHNIIYEDSSLNSVLTSFQGHFLKFQLA